MSSTFPPPLTIGVLFLPQGAQLLDMSPVDLFAMLSQSYLIACQLPTPLTALGLPEVQISYICESSEVECTANLHLAATCDLMSKTVAPGTLDVLMIPGPDPSLVPSEGVKSFVKAHAAEKRTSVLTICTGIFVAGHSGILSSKEVTGPRGILPVLRKKFPDTKWVDARWQRDGNIWCSAGITNGLDMTAAFIRERWPGALSDTVCALADVGDRSQDYPNGQVKEVSWWLWLISRAWLKGLVSAK